jgi:hypothetical protein
MARSGWRVRSLMALVAYVAVDCAAFCHGIWHDSGPGLLVALAMTVYVPFALGAWWALKRIDWSGNTLY